MWSTTPATTTDIASCAARAVVCFLSPRISSNPQRRTFMQRDLKKTGATLRKVLRSGQWLCGIMKYVCRKLKMWINKNGSGKNKRCLRNFICISIHINLQNSSRCHLNAKSLLQLKILNLICSQRATPVNLFHTTVKALSPLPDRLYYFPWDWLSFPAYSRGGRKHHWKPGFNQQEKRL